MLAGPAELHVAWRSSRHGWRRDELTRRRRGVSPRRSHDTAPRHERLSSRPGAAPQLAGTKALGQVDSRYVHGLCRLRGGDHRGRVRAVPVVMLLGDRAVAAEGFSRRPARASAGDHARVFNTRELGGLDPGGRRTSSFYSLQSRLWCGPGAKSGLIMTLTLDVGASGVGCSSSALEPRKRIRAK